MSSKDNNIRSALEIALERAQKLGALSAEEKQILKDEEFAAAGEALAERYLNGLPLRDIEVELGRRSGENRRAISRYLLLHLVDAIDIKHVAADETILVAIEHVSGDSGFVQTIRVLLQEYERAVEKSWQENGSALEIAKRNELKLKGISGSAVELEIETCPEWLQIRDRLDFLYQERLKQIKVL